MNELHVSFTEDDYKVYVAIAGRPLHDVFHIKEMDKANKVIKEMGSEFIFGTPEEAEKFFMNLLEELRQFCKNIPGFKRADDQTR